MYNPPFDKSLRRGYPLGLQRNPIPMPQHWGIQRESTNPVIPVNLVETTEQYVPSPIVMANGDIWIYVKGSNLIYAYKSTDNGVTFSIQNSGDPVIAHGDGGAWDADVVLDPSVVYDRANGTIHMYYKGGNNTIGVGHATASDSDPTAFTKDAGNPILDVTTAQTAVGLANCNDVMLTDVIKIGSTYYYYGFIGKFDEAAGYYHLIYATGTGWDDPTVQAIIMNPAELDGDGVSFVAYPQAFKHPYSDTYVMMFVEGIVEDSDPQSLRYQAIATSMDGINWERQGHFLLPDPDTSWESMRVHQSRILKYPTGNFDEPYFVNDKLLCYYSARNQTGAALDQTGLLYVSPNFAREGREVILPLIFTPTTTASAVADNMLNIWVPVPQCYRGKLARLVACIKNSTASQTTTVGISKMDPSAGQYVLTPTVSLTATSYATVCTKLFTIPDDAAYLGLNMWVSANTGYVIAAGVQVFS